jgi:hypothetical protein
LAGKYEFQFSRFATEQDLCSYFLHYLCDETYTTICHGFNACKLDGSYMEFSRADHKNFTTKSSVLRGDGYDLPWVLNRCGLEVKLLLQSSEKDLAGVRQVVIQRIVGFPNVLLTETQLQC